MAFFKKRKQENTAMAIGKPEYIIVGLGNPGKEYELSHHNAGFLCLDMLCNKYGFVTDRAKFRSFTANVCINGTPCLVMRPQTFMNNSGEAVKSAADFYKIPPEKIIVIFDDISLPLGTLRIRLKGSAGGHNGVKSIIWQLNSDSFPRLKIGVGAKPDADSDLKDYVLSKFSKEDIVTLKATYERATAAIDLMVKGENEAAMSKYNG